MMRKDLKQYDGQLLTLVAKVVRFSDRKVKLPHTNNETVLLSNIRINERDPIAIAEHVWVISGKWASHIKRGDVIRFDTRVISYIKAYKSLDQEFAIDYTLDKPMKAPEILHRKRTGLHR